MISKFEMVAKTFKGLENVLAEELKQLGAGNVVAGNRMVSFTGDLAMLYKANIGCRTAPTRHCETRQQTSIRPQVDFQASS